MKININAEIVDSTYEKEIVQFMKKIISKSEYKVVLTDKKLIQLYIDYITDYVLNKGISEMDKNITDVLKEIINEQLDNEYYE